VQQRTWLRGGSGTGSVDAVLVGADLIVDVDRVQVGRIRVKPTRTAAEREVDRHARRQPGTVLLARVHRRDTALIDAVDGVLVQQRRPLRRARCTQRTRHGSGASESVMGKSQLRLEFKSRF